MNSAPKDQRFSYFIPKYWRYFLPCWLFPTFLGACGMMFNGTFKGLDPLLLTALSGVPFIGVNFWAYRVRKVVPKGLFIFLTTFVPFAIFVLFFICLIIGDLWLESMKYGGQ